MDTKKNSLGLTPFKPRLKNFHEVRDVSGYSMKLYTVLYGDPPIQWERFELGFELAKKKLPSPAISEGRLGVGFMIFHQGLTGKYLVLCWWDTENELPTKVFIERDNIWREAIDESFCVWDLEIIWNERELYLHHILSENPNLSTYLDKSAI